MGLSGKTLSYTLDISRVPCHCNAAVYFSAMPAPEMGDGLDYYCDANCVGGQCCPEFDTLESNKHTIVSTLHNCEASGDWWANCDGAGCGINSWDVDQEAIGQ